MSDTKEVIQARLLAEIDDTYDKTEGSFVYDVEKPVAVELEKSYIAQDLITNRGFADTATGTYLERKVGAYGLYRKIATNATTTVTITGTTGALITIGDKVATDLVDFTFTEDKTIGETGIETVNVICDIAGTIGNVPVGAIKYFPVTLAGLVSVTNAIAITNGYIAETDNELRQRYYVKVQNPGTSGNVAAYIAWCLSVTGVGGAKITPLWNGNGTVKATIINGNKRAADAQLITDIETYIETVRPIGAIVTVISATEKPINIIVTLTIDTDNYVLADIQTSIETILIDYFKTLAFTETYVSYAKIGNLIFDVAGVLDYSGLTVNSGTANITTGTEEIAVLGGVTLG
ncbi:baseplate J/gp47 family protein [Clostridium sp.]|jgi:uncharacterized phage protein gp47/JayE|uniref:baseplate J/gp47 family protein n=1 Tax=Clostridium sp. TaxID=1506 RepID=UPI003EEB6F02